MHAIDSDGHLNNTFTAGDPGQGLPATVVSAKWLNTIQAELLAILQAGGVTPADTDNDQVLEAIVNLLNAKGVLLTNAYVAADQLITDYINAQVAVLRSESSPAIRQTVLDGPVDGNGKASFLTYAGLTISTTGLDVTPLSLTAAMGFDAFAQDRSVKISTNKTWPAVINNSAGYLLLKLNSNGSVTPELTGDVGYGYALPAAPIMNQLFFLIPQMRMKKWNGTAWTDYVGVVVGSYQVTGGVMSLQTYAYQGMDYSELSMTSDSQYVLNHKIGTNLVDTVAMVRFLTVQGAYNIGDRVQINYASQVYEQNQSHPNSHTEGICIIPSSLTSLVATSMWSAYVAGTTPFYKVINKTGGYIDVASPVTNLKFEFLTQRTF